MPLIARTSTRRRFIPPSQRGDKNPFAVFLRPDGKDVQIQIENIRGKLGIADDVETEDAVKTELQKEGRKVSFPWEYIRIFLDGWENLVEPVLDENGEPKIGEDGEFILRPVEFIRDEEDQPTDETIAKIEMPIRAEIFSELVGTTQLSRSDRKNSA